MAESTEDLSVHVYVPSSSEKRGHCDAGESGPGAAGSALDDALDETLDCEARDGTDARSMVASAPVQAPPSTPPSTWALSNDARWSGVLRSSGAGAGSSVTRERRGKRVPLGVRTLSGRSPVDGVRMLCARDVGVRARSPLGVRARSPLGVRLPLLLRERSPVLLRARPSGAGDFSRPSGAGDFSRDRFAGALAGASPACLAPEAMSEPSEVNESTESADVRPPRLFPLVLRRGRRGESGREPGGESPAASAPASAAEGQPQRGHVSKRFATSAATSAAATSAAESESDAAASKAFEARRFRRSAWRKSAELMFMLGFAKRTRAKAPSSASPARSSKPAARAFMSVRATSCAAYENRAAFMSTVGCRSRRRSSAWSSSSSSWRLKLATISRSSIESRLSCLRSARPRAASPSTPEWPAAYASARASFGLRGGAAKRFKVVSGCWIKTVSPDMRGMSAAVRGRGGVALKADAARASGSASSAAA
mmetsp:Transcript_29129/g.100496  ORF Transcript_29129/g.100496 Transcript_29129/m.100496 type:complete len:483 (-) Transcript_29129:645-2093(-)